MDAIITGNRFQLKLGTYELASWGVANYQDENVFWVLK
jgi:hypothetical protein